MQNECDGSEAKVQEETNAMTRKQLLELNLALLLKNEWPETVLNVIVCNASGLCVQAISKQVAGTLLPGFSEYSDAASFESG